MKTTQGLYDIYVLKTSGLPLFSSCTGSEYCMTHMDQHELQSGFLAAIHSFSKESFTKSDLKKLEYDDIKLSFKSDQDLIMAFVHSIKVDDKKIRKDITKAWDNFKEKYADKIDGIYIEDHLFDDFQDDLQHLGVISSKLMSIRHQQFERDENRSIRGKLLTWLRSRA